MAGRSTGPPPIILVIHCPRRHRLHHLSLKPLVAVRIYWAGLRHVLAKHGLAGHFRHHRGLASSRAPRHGLHPAINPEKSPNRHRSCCGWRPDRFDGSSSRYSRRPADHSVAGGNHSAADCAHQHRDTHFESYKPERRLAVVSLRTETTIDFRYYHSHL